MIRKAIIIASGVSAFLGWHVIAGETWGAQQTRANARKHMQIHARGQCQLTQNSLQSNSTYTMASILVPVLYLVIIVGGLLIFSRFYRKRTKSMYFIWKFMKIYANNNI